MLTLDFLKENFDQSRLILQFKFSDRWQNAMALPSTPLIEWPSKVLAKSLLTINRRYFTSYSY